MAYGGLQWVTITMLLFWFLLLLLFVTFHVSVVYMCMVYVHVFVQMNIFLCVHTEGRKECQVFCSITFYSILLRQGVWLNLELGCQRDPLQLQSYGLGQWTKHKGEWELSTRILLSLFPDCWCSVACSCCHIFLIRMYCILNCKPKYNFLSFFMVLVLNQRSEKSS